MRKNITNICINNVNRNIMGNQRSFIYYSLLNNNIDGNMVALKEFYITKGVKRVLFKMQLCP